MVAHIATYTITGNLFNQTTRLQANYATVNTQSATGLKSTTYDGIAGDAQQLLSVVSQQNTLTAQGTVIKAAQTRINGLQNVMGTISDTVNQANSMLSLVLGGLDTSSAGSTSYVDEAKSIRDELGSLLNTQVGGKYLFGGNVTNKAPVDLTASTYNPTSFGTADTGYYQGDNGVESVRASDSMTVGYGITANNPAFEQAFRALNLYIANPTDPTVIQNAFNMIKTSLTGIADVSGSLIAKANVVQSEASVNSGTADYLSQVISGLRDVDTAAAAVQASQIETQLQASYSSLAKLLNLRLTDYVK